MQPMPPDRSPIYAGFWSRFAGWLIDVVVIYAVQFALSFAFGLLLGLNAAFTGGRPETGWFWWLFAITSIAGAWVYRAAAHSAYGRTVGQHVLGLRVVTADGGRPSFGRATGRFFASWLSIVLYLGYLSSLLHPRRNTLHDSLAGTHVVRGAEFDHWRAAALLPPPAPYAPPRPALRAVHSLSDWVPPAPPEVTVEARDLGMSLAIAPRAPGA